MMWYGGSGVEWWGWLLMSLGMVAFWGFLIWAIWFFVTAVTRRSDEPKSRPSGTQQILDERLARGEIDVEEYRRLREVMTSERAHAGDGRASVSAGDQR